MQERNREKERRGSVEKKKEKKMSPVVSLYLFFSRMFASHPLESSSCSQKPVSYPQCLESPGIRADK